MGVPVAIGVLALFDTNCDVQHVEVTPEGITLHGLSGREQLPWRLIHDFRVRRRHVVVTRIGVPMQRKLDPVLDIDCGGHGFTVVEPARTHTKLKLVNRLLEHAPAEHQQNLQLIAREWP
jgi:hypothetical protein